jgi:hypothetical protein
MSKGAYTVIDSYIGKQEALLTSTAILNARLEKLYKENLEKGDYISPIEVIPTILDIERTHCIYVKSQYKPFVAFAHDYFKTNAEGPCSRLDRDTRTIKFALRSNNGDFIGDQVFKFRFDQIGSANSTLKYRYCDLPGLRLIKNIRLTTGKDIIDEYTTEGGLLYYKSMTDATKIKSLEELLGQEQEVDCESSSSESRQITKYKNGLQTYKQIHVETDIWIPLFFDYSSPERSLYMKNIGSNQLYIELDLAPSIDIIQSINTSGQIIELDSISISSAVMYTKNYYIDPSINALMKDSSNLSIIRVNRMHSEILTSNANSILLSKLKFPIEMFRFGFRPNINVNNKTNGFSDWHKFSIVSRQQIGSTTLKQVCSDSSGPLFQLFATISNIITSSPSVDKIGLSMQDNGLYELTEEKFYSMYRTYITPDMSGKNETGIYSISPAIYPFAFNPSGYINNSTARDAVLKYEGKNITSSSPTTFYCNAQCINFILFIDQTIRLRYIT